MLRSQLRGQLLRELFPGSVSLVPLYQIVLIVFVVLCTDLILFNLGIVFQ